MTTLDLTSVTAPSGVGYDRLARATADLEPPFAVVDLGALKKNADSLVSRAGGKPVRLASKSVRCRAIADAVLERPGFHGVLALTLSEALWLASEVEDVVVGYPTADVTALRHLAGNDELLAKVTLMIDDVSQLDLIERCTPPGPPIRVCIDLDASLRLLGGRVHLGPRRSPVHSPREAVALTRVIVERPRFRLVGMMAYEGQIAGVGDNAGSIMNRLQIRGMQMMSAKELRGRRAAAVDAVRQIAELEFVNGGGTGSIERTVSEPAVTEVAAGSGLYCPTLFDTYRGFRPQPAAFYVLSVVRKPTPSYATILGGGWVASGATGADRSPTPSWPGDLSLTALEGAGEAQTPLRGPGAAALTVGDRVWFRHAKAGELCERVNELHLVDGDQVIATVPTYRGEGRAFL